MRAALTGAALLAAGIAMFLYGGTMDAREPLAEPLVYTGIGLVLVSLVVLFVAWRRSRSRAYSAAVESTDAVARWQVYATDMASFRALDRARAGRLWSLKNSLKFPDPVPPEGFPIVIGEKSLLFGDKYYGHGVEWFGEVGEISLHEGQPGFLEISYYLKTTKAPLIVVHRIPVPASAREQAALAFAHLQSQIKPHDRDRLRSKFGAHFEAAEQTTDAPHRLQRRRKIVLPIIALLCLALGAFIFFKLLTRQPAYLANETFPTTANETDPLPVNETYPSTPPG